MNKFHYAFKVKDIASTIAFYHGILGYRIGRQTEKWVDFDFFGHQLSAHVSEHLTDLDYCGLVDGIAVPIPHFGCNEEQKIIWEPKKQQNYFPIVTKSINIPIGFIYKDLIS